MSQVNQEGTSSFERSKQRLEEIVSQVRSKDIPLAQSLDLFEEAIELGTECASLIDHADFSLAELGVNSSDTEQDIEVDAEANSNTDAIGS